jgi:hypothetical protein
MYDYPFHIRVCLTVLLTERLPLSLYVKTKYYYAWLKCFQPLLDLPDIRVNIMKLYCIKFLFDLRNEIQNLFFSYLSVSDNIS